MAATIHLAIEPSFKCKSIWQPLIEKNMVDNLLVKMLLLPIIEKHENIFIQFRLVNEAESYFGYKWAMVVRFKIAGIL